MNDAEQQAITNAKLINSNQQLPTKYPRYFRFYDNQETLQIKLLAMSQEELDHIVDANITITTTLFEQASELCECCTFFFGFILLFPFLLMLCKWWKRMTQHSYTLSEATYRSLQKLLSSPHLKNMTLTVTDNLFDDKTAKLICDMVWKSQLVGFTLYNIAEDYDYNGRQYSDFSQNMSGLKQKPGLMFEARWGNQIVI